VAYSPPLLFCQGNITENYKPRCYFELLIYSVNIPIPIIDIVAISRSLIFQVDYPEIEEGLQPRHRFMSAYEQKVEAPDRNFQYVLFAAEPYETIAFKIPNREIDKDTNKFYTDWDASKQTFTVQFYFKDELDGPAPPSGPPPPPSVPPPPPPN